MPAETAVSQPAETLIPPTSTPNRRPPPSATPEALAQGTDGYPWWNDTVFYEIFVRSFYDSDGDGIGDLNGVIEKLDYLNDGDPATTDDLGVTGIWLMPIMVSPSYHGYDVVDYFQVDQEYGTNEDFLRLMEEAHARGIRVIVDLVMNHTSTQHPWFEASRRPQLTTSGTGTYGKIPTPVGAVPPAKTCGTPPPMAFTMASFGAACPT